MRTHSCAVCTEVIPIRVLMCREHWRLVPRHLQREVMGTYQTWRWSLQELKRADTVTAMHVVRRAGRRYEEARERAIAAVIGDREGATP
jgi:hypothetical protein